MQSNYHSGRRSFVQNMAKITGAVVLGLPQNIMGQKNENLTARLSINTARSAFEREPLIHSYGFKGGYITRLWQVATRLGDDSGNRCIGLGIQSPLWSDSEVTSRWSESGSNSLMYNMTNRALQIIENQAFDSPISMTDYLLDEIHSYGKKITRNENLRKTFALNALVSVDNAAWLLFAKQNSLVTFDEMIPQEYKHALSYKHKKIASIPTISYSTPESGLSDLVDEGYCFIKIKIGAPGTQQEMLEADMERMRLIHKTMGSTKVSNFPGGKIIYYLDANGRYESKDTFKRFLDHCKRIGAFEQIMIVEEPFPEEFREDVFDIDVKITADESAHTDKDALERMDMGYSVMALKPVAKTLSMTMKIAKLAYERNIPCLCADLTVNPVLVDWNKSVAARLAPLPGLKVGLLETNGHQNYKNWEKMRDYHPMGRASWNNSKNGTFSLEEDFYKENAGLFQTLMHYNNLFGH